MRTAAVFSCAALALVSAALGQQNAPHAGYVYPAGARIGTTAEVTIGGQFLDGASRVLVSGDGLTAAVSGYLKPLTPAQANALRMELRALTEKRDAGTGLTSGEMARASEIRSKLAAFVRAPASAAIVENVTLKVQVARDARPGVCELRLLTQAGLTNPVAFRIGELPEYSRPLVREVANPAGALIPAKPEDPVEVALPAVLNGQIRPGAIDQYRFNARKGQHIVAAAAARELTPYISDAVPGWFQAALRIRAEGGNEVAYADHYRFHPDPVAEFTAPADGGYILEIRDSLYRGRQDFVYRITIGEVPFLTGLFPLGAQAGRKTAIELSGWNLPATTASEKRKSPGLYPLSVRSGAVSSNSLPFAVDSIAGRAEKEPNDQPKGAQRVKLPVFIDGRIGRAGDRDIFRFDGRAGDRVVAEAIARRLGSPLDSVLQLTDAKGRILASNDDFEDRGAGLLTHQADSRILVTLPAKGTYYLQIADAQGSGGAEYAYRLRIARPQPDYELCIVPSSVNLRAGMAAVVTAYALRRDGFAGEIVLGLKDAPAGFSLSGGAIPAGEDKMRLTLTAPGRAPAEPVTLHLEGRATVEGREAVRQAVAAEEMTQAFAYHHLIPARDWLARVQPAERPRTPWSLMEEKPVRLRAGRTAAVRVRMPLGQLASQVRLALSDPPEGIAIEGVTPDRMTMTVLLRADRGKAKPGLKGNLLVEAFLERTGNERPGRRSFLMGVLPAIPFEVVE